MPDTTHAPKPKRPKRPEPAGSSTKRSNKLRADRAAQGLAEVRGIWAKPAHHARIKALAENAENY